MKQKFGPGKAPAERVLKDIRRQTRCHYAFGEARELQRQTSIRCISLVKAEIAHFLFEPVESFFALVDHDCLRKEVGIE
jgi:hypothetical protein